MVFGYNKCRLGSWEGYKEAESIRIFGFCRNNPHDQLIQFGDMVDSTDSRIMSVKYLFSYLGIPEERLKEVYDHDGEHFTGSFTQNGMQNLATILNKAIIFAELGFIGIKYQVRKLDTCVP